MTTTARAPRNPAKSGNPATAAAAKKAKIEAEARDAQEKEAAKLKAQEEFRNLILPDAVLDDEGYEIIPDQSALEGGSYKFKVAGVAYTLPNLQYLPVSLAMSFSKMQETDVNAAVFGRYAPGVLDHASADQLRHIIKRWTDHSKGVGLGE